MSVVNQPMPENLLTKCIDTPLGLIEVAVHNDSLWYVEFVSYEHVEPCSGTRHELLDMASMLLTEYANGENVDFSPLLANRSNYGTEFQKTVWQALTEIPYGETWSYGQLAEYIGKPSAARAVGAANGKNPLAIIVPCHRVIGQNGNLTGYAGGLNKKLQLLKLESSFVGNESYDLFNKTSF